MYVSVRVHALDGSVVVASTRCGFIARMAVCPDDTLHGGVGLAGASRSGEFIDFLGRGMRTLVAVESVDDSCERAQHDRVE